MDCNKILTDEDFMEIKQHGTSDCPFQYYYDDLEFFDFHCIEWHWHREFEFLYVESGEIICGIGEKQIILSKGDAIFINSKILHRFYASSGGVIPNFVCMPEFIAPENSLVYKKYILPIISSNMSFQCFQIAEPWQARIIQIMIKIMGTQENEKIRELSTLALLQDLWLIFYENVKLSDKEKMQTVDEAAQKRVQLMMQYIHENYNHEMSLDEIASHIGISKSTALNLFQRFLHTTPVSYLIGYRLQAASWLLKNTNKKVKTIAYESGFRNVDYFCRLFKKRYHLTPSEYRCACLKQYISK
ncbi:AraC family transcriptional regulator [Eubacterium ramulus]|nr:helix-turn-helix domain-containing protein [Eubacterium ramulus]MSC94921.1 helix-turn-helix domain-containing protein [Eubacterium ramulus]RYS96759.1 AraC family transcriptional regulator [Eubacterium ramulus]